MISRVADHCFWFGRYLERSESTARVLAVTTTLALDAELTPRQSWLPLVIVSGEESTFVKRFGDDAASDAETVQQYITWDEENLTSLRNSVSGARWNARSIREVVSLEAFEAINELHVWIGSDGARAEYDDLRYGFYRHVRQSTQLCLGLLRSTMLHDTPLDFIWLGVLLERVSQTARLLDVHHHVLAAQTVDAGEDAPAGGPHGVVETALWLSLLRACSGFEPFMKRNQGEVSRRAVAAFLLLESRFPRSVRYCAHSAFERLQAIRPPGARSLPGGRSLARLGRLDDLLSVMTPEDVDLATMHELLTHVVDESHSICDEVGRELLSYEPPAAPEGATQAATQAATQGATQSATQASTQGATQASTQSATQASTQSATQASTQGATQASTQSATQGTK